MMKTWSILVAVVMLALGASLAVGEAGAAAKSVRGAITKFDGANITVGDATFATDDKTVVTDGAGGKKAVSDLAVGQNVVVKLSDDGKTATAIVTIAKNVNPGGRR